MSIESTGEHDTIESSVHSTKEETCKQDASNEDGPIKKPFVKFKQTGMFTNKHLGYLQSKYQLNKYPSTQEMKQMAKETELKYSKIYYWFSEERARNNEMKSKKYSDDVLEILEEQFEKDNCPTREIKMKLVKKTKLTYSQVDAWFRNKCKRIKLKKNSKTKREEGKTANLTKDQLEFLLEKYHKDMYPDEEEINDMASELNLSYEKIFNWFCSTRGKNGHTSGDRYSKEQLEILNKEFNRNKYPNCLEKEKISALTKLTVSQIHSWYTRMRKNLI